MGLILISAGGPLSNPAESNRQPPLLPARHNLLPGARRDSQRWWGNGLRPDPSVIYIDGEQTGAVKHDLGAWAIEWPGLFVLSGLPGSLRRQPSDVG
jgi:hypothetical protein